MARVVWIQPEAPPKPATGDSCNGCGLCCLAEPCPVGTLVSLRRTGPCRALQWHPEERRYQCGMLVHPTRYLGAPGLNPQAWPNRMIRRWARRMIAAGIGCDADLDATLVGFTGDAQDTPDILEGAAPAPPPSSATKDNR